MVVPTATEDIRRGMVWLYGPNMFNVGMVGMVGMEIFPVEPVSAIVYVYVYVYV
jgi:hypothetical protein